jgi:2-polyprenyl-6-methoxyphenol hydroxylase-like FAD-dependent oxidoreductase
MSSSRPQVILRRIPADPSGEVKSVPTNGHNGYVPDADNSETVFAKYVIGADGSKTRQLCVILANDQLQARIPG